MPRKVLICIPCLLVGGTEVHTAMLVRALVEAGYEVAVCAYYEFDPVMVDTVRRAGARVILLKLARRGRRRNVARMPRLVARLACLIRRQRPDFVHVQYMAPGAAPIVAARWCRVPTVFATVHVPAHAYAGHLWLPRTAARGCDVFLCVSQSAERSFFGHGRVLEHDGALTGRRHFTIPNAVDAEKARRTLQSGEVQARRKQLGLEGVPVVGCIGRIAREKGQRWLLEAMPRIVREVPRVKLLLVGDGAEKENLADHARLLGVDAQLVCTGRVPPDDVLAYFGVADVVAVPSMWEGFGLSAAEAMAMERPVVAADVDGLAEVVDHGRTGLLVAPGDVDGLGAAVAGLLEDENIRRRYGRQGRRRVEREFSYRTFAQRIQRLYAAGGKRARQHAGRTTGRAGG